MTRIQVRAGIVMLLLVVAAPAAATHTVSLNGFDTSKLETRAGDQSGGAADDEKFPTALLYSETSAAVDGAASSSATNGLSNDGFELSFAHARAAEFQSYGDNVADIYSSVDQDTSYTATGSCCATDSEGCQVTPRLSAGLHAGRDRLRGLRRATRRRTRTCCSARPGVTSSTRTRDR